MTTEPLDYDTIGQLSRAVFAQLAPLSGSRATGTATFTNPTGADIDLPPNRYLLPIVTDEARPHRLFKVAPNPATITQGSIASQQWCGGEWTIPASGTLSINVVSNIGGADQNLPAGTPLKLLVPPTGLDADAPIDAAITDGTNTKSLPFSGGDALIRRFVFWEQISGASAVSDFFRGQSGAFPAMLLVWTGSETLQGRTSGGRQGATRGGRGHRFFRENFQAYVGTGLQGAADIRRAEGLISMQAACRLLSDKLRNRDMEILSAMGAGVEITNRQLAIAGPQNYVYQFDFTVNQVWELNEERTFQAWETWHMEASLPGREAPEPTAPITLVNEDQTLP